MICVTTTAPIHSAEKPSLPRRPSNNGADANGADANGADANGADANGDNVIAWSSFSDGRKDFSRAAEDSLGVWYKSACMTGVQRGGI